MSAIYDYFHFFVTAPNFIPSDLNLVSTSSTSITVNWSVPSTPPDADGYVIYFASGSGPGMSVKVMGGSVNEHTLEDLTPGSIYNISIWAYQDILGPASVSITVMTNDCSQGMLLKQPSFQRLIMRHRSELKAQFMMLHFVLRWRDAFSIYSITNCNFTCTSSPAQQNYTITC